MFIVVMWLWRRYVHRTENALDSCECMAIQKRAEKMHSAVDSKLRAMDSRDPDKPQRGPTDPEQPPTEETPPISTDVKGQTRISVVIAVALLAGTMLAGWEMRASTATPNEPTASRNETATSPNETSIHVAGCTPGASFDARLAELRTRPTLSAVSVIDREPPTAERRAEVLAALKPLLASENKSIRLTAGNAAKRWE